MMSANDVSANNDAAQAHARISFGWATGTSARASLWIGETDNVSAYSPVAWVKLSRKGFAQRVVFDQRVQFAAGMCSGFAAGCKARLRLAGYVLFNSGLCPPFGLSPKDSGPKAAPRA